MASVLRQQAIQVYQKASGRRILPYLDELNRTQWLGRDELLDLQRARLHRLLEHAYGRVPYYRRLFDSVGFRPADVLVDLSAMRRIPILTKAVIRENFDSLLVQNPQLRKEMTAFSTSGSTGEPLFYMQDNSCRDHAMADLYRHLGWAGWRLGQCYAWIWGADFEEQTSQNIRSRTRDWILNRMETNAFSLSEESMRAFATQVRRRRPMILVGYPSSMCWFAEFVQEHGLDDINFEAISSAAEVLYPDQRQLLEKVFGAQVFDRYATRELGTIAYECEAHTGLHVTVENIYVEVLQDGEPAKAGEVGEIILTNLHNYGMPFIRYRLEDIGTWSTRDSCECGRRLPMMDLKLARSVDTFRTRDGRRIWGEFATPILEVPGVKRFQVVQKSLDLVVVRIVRDADLNEAKLIKIESELKLALGEQVTVTFEFPDEIPVYGSGKYRYAISEIDQPQGALEVSPGAQAGK
jgi:phenylacetate-coenzyme A ligase PaaK-like adenylate-forming protein